jgi:arylsulfatase A-like enzyme
MRFALGCGLLAAAVAGCSPRGPGTPSVLLLTVDTLRPDYLSANGYDLPTTPFLDSLVNGGWYFDQAVAPVPRTTPALASLLTGAYPHTTRVRSLTDTLATDVTSLTEVLGGFGYQTFAVVTNHVLPRKRGLARGFEIYDMAIDGRGARETTSAALRALDRLDPGAPVFAWVHYIDPHVPYHPDPAIAAEFDPDYRGRYRFHFGELPAPEARSLAVQPFPPDLPKRVATHHNPLPESVNRHVRRLYAADIRTLDREIARLVGVFRDRIGDDLLIVFTADHGESLGEHDFYFDHGDYVYNAGSRVPLAFVLPPSHPAHGSGRCAGWVSLVDVVPTLLDLLGRVPPAGMARQLEGRSLTPCLAGRTLADEPVFVESGHSYYPESVPRRIRNDTAGRFRAVVWGDWKLIWTPFQAEDRAWELFDLRADPEETRNLYAPDHPELTRLRSRLDEWLARQDPEDLAAPRTVSEEDRASLRALGYLDGSDNSPPDLE